MTASLHHPSPALRLPVRRSPWVAGLLALALCQTSDVCAASRSKKSVHANDPAALAASPANASTEFAPLPESHPLAGIWNEPEFTRRLLGSYGFHPDLEPRLSPEEQVLYREQVLPLLRQDPTLAIPVLEGAIKPSGSPTFDYTLGTVYFQSGAFTNAVTHYEAAVAKFPDFLRAHRNLALALVRDGRYAEAVRPLTRTLTLGGADGTIYGLMAFVLVNQDQFVAAETAYRQALLYDPDNADYQMGLVKCQVATGNYEAALAMLNELLERYPDREVLWSLQANIYVQRNDLPKAAVNYEILRRLGKATAANLTLLGDVYVAQDASDLALSAYLAAAAADGGTNATRSLRAAEIFASRGAWDQARTLLTDLRQGGEAPMPREDLLKLWRLDAKLAMARGEADQAVKVIEQILGLNPLDGEALLMAGDHYKQSGDLERAEFRYDAAAKLEGFAVEALVKQAQLLVEAQRYTQAIELLRRALKLEPRENVQRYLERVEAVAARVRS